MRLMTVLASALMLSVAGGGALAQQCPKPPLPEHQGVWALAVSWQAGFCQTFQPADRLPRECPAASRLDRFTLHGLWPQWREYCPEGVPAADIARNPELRSRPCEVRRERLPAVSLSPGLSEALAAVMPGVQSQLDRHEFFKHGTCAGMSQDDYFRTAVDLVEALNRTAFRDYIRGQQGREVTFGDVCKAIGRTLGPKAVAAVEADSKRHTGPDGKQRHYLTEFRLWLRPVDGRLALADANYVAIRPGARTLGRPANPLCDDRLDYTLYVDVPGMER